MGQRVRSRRIGEENRGREKHRGHRPSGLGQHIARAGGAEYGLTGAAEHRANLRALALLEQDHNDQREADHDMNPDNDRNHLDSLAL